VDCVLLALDGAGVVPPIAVAKRYGDIGLLYMRKHLFVQLVTQARERGHYGICIGILGLKVCSYLGILLVTQPGVVVGEGDSVEERLGGDFAGGGRGGELGLSHQIPV